jgi:hypothetical protein
LQPSRREIRLLDNEGIARVAFQTRALFRLADPRFNAKTDQETGHLTKTVLCVPLRTAKGDIIGGRKAFNKFDGPFTKLPSLSNPGGSLRPAMSGYAKIDGEDMRVWQAFTRRIIHVIRVEIWSWIP